MTLASATRLGPYEILAPLGAGGMGEVYRSRDTRLGREVAIKVLPAEAAADPERLHRFEQEAKAVSALNHPHIVTLHEVGESPAGPYLVLEKIEGRSLRDLLREGALPVRRVLALGAQIVEGLAKAHDAGIVHRDLKPENVMVTGDGFAKILDFGLAKLVLREISGRAGEPGAELADRTTIVDPTVSGRILGTPGYLSPEQAAGRPADFRADQFALGALLYELATGERPFKRETLLESLAAVIRDEPEPLRTKNPALPAPLGWIVERCLAKDPNDRYASTRDLARDLAHLRDHLSEATLVGAAPEARKARASWHRWLVASAALAIALLAGLQAGRFLREPPAAALPVRAALVLPEEISIGELAISPDGGVLAFTGAQPGGISALFVRALVGTDTRLLSHTQGASFPFWSPDGRFIGFFSGGKLQKVAFDGGPAVTICDAERGMGATWNRDDQMVFAPSATSALVRVSAGGGHPAPVTRLNEARRETTHRFPFFLPDGRRFLYSVARLGDAGATESGETGASAIRVAALDGSLDAPIVDTFSNATFIGGSLLYVRDDTLFAQRFDPTRLRTAGVPVPLADRFSYAQWAGFHAFAASERFLLYMPAIKVPSRLLWFDRHGNSLGSVGEPALFLTPRLSPDGKQIAVDVLEPARNVVELRLYNLATGANRKFAFGDWNNLSPVWSPDGTRLAFLTDEGSVQLHARIVFQPLDRARLEPFGSSADDRLPDDWSPDGRSISFRKWAAKGQRNTELWVARFPDARDPTPVATVGESGNSRFSPDGRWLAYQSDESGQAEIYVRPYPSLEGKWQVSAGGGRFPVWRGDGRELYYLGPDDRIMAVSVNAAPAFRAGVAAPLFRAIPSRFEFGAAPSTLFDVTSDGKRILVNGFEANQGSPPLNLVVDWQSQARAGAAASR